jgi:PDDEXK-like domain of unknown function (DUF3799)
MFSFPLIREITEETAPGLYRIDHGSYHASSGLSSTRVKKALDTYRHYSAQTVDSEALAFGRAVHTALLEPDEFEKTYTTMPRFEGHPNSNAYKAAKADWMTQNEGKELLTNEQAETLAAISNSVIEHPLWPQTGIMDSEVAAIARCPETGLLLKCKADKFGAAIMDLKTTRGSVLTFADDVLKYGYHISTAFYQDVFQLATGERLPFIHIIAEKQEPYLVDFVTLSDDFVEEGRKLYKAALKRIAMWEKSQASRTYSTRIKTLNVTSRVIYKSKEILDRILAEMEPT